MRLHGVHLRLSQVPPKTHLSTHQIRRRSLGVRRQVPRMAHPGEIPAQGPLTRAQHCPHGLHHNLQRRLRQPSIWPLSLMPPHPESRRHRPIPERNHLQRGLLGQVRPNVPPTQGSPSTTHLREEVRRPVRLPARVPQPRAATIQQAGHPAWQLGH